MSRIDDLIRQHCPEGVEYRAIGDVAQYSRDRVASEGLTSETFVGVDNLLADKHGKERAMYRPNTTSLTAYRKGDILLGNIRPYLKKVWLADGDGGCSGDVLAVRRVGEYQARLHPRFMYYLLSSDDFFAYSNQHAKGAKMPRGSKEAILRYRIPVPPLEVQREIVRVLDLFQSLEAELEAELEARRRQFAHYREVLMDFGDLAPRVPMGDLGEIFRGRRFVKADYAPEGIPAIHYGELYTKYGTSARETVTHVRTDLEPVLRFAQPGDVVIAEVGETVADVGRATAWLGSDKVAIHDGCYGFRHAMDPVFVAYFLQTERYHADKSRHVARAKVKRLSLPGLKQVRIPVPSMADQRRIVAILEQFDELTADLSSGLPAELAARRKQYEYYRDRLLTFEEAA